MRQETQNRRFHISGKVQGVGFRHATRQCAQRLGLTGWVRNRADGSVEASACGDEEALAEFERWLRHGPNHAVVDQVDRVTDSEPSALDEEAQGAGQFMISR